MIIDLNTEIDNLRSLISDIDYGDVNNNQLVKRIGEIVENLEDLQSEIDDIVEDD